LVAALAEAADAHWALARADKHSHQAWHCGGHKVLQLRRAKKPGGVRITAGVQFTNPTKDQQKPYVVTVTEPVTPGHRAKIEAVIAHAISNRLNLVDDTDVESRMQAALAAADMPGLGLTSPGNTPRGVRQDAVARSGRTRHGSRRRAWGTSTFSASTGTTGCTSWKPRSAATGCWSCRRWTT
jgi:hypothetical protein